MVDLLVGCPVSSRAWVLPSWFDHVDAACDRAGILPRFVFAVSAHDLDSLEAIRSSAQTERVEFLDTGEAQRPDQRDWTQARYEQMTQVRNFLLRGVRALAPDLFLSVDSDILLHPEAVANLVETSERFDAVGGRLYMMSTGVRYPSYGMWKRDGAIRRQDSEGVFKVDVIMACKLMRPAAYAIDYRVHRYGEDIGWSRACQEAGVKLGWDGRVISKHVLSPEMLGVPDQRLGW